MRLVRSRLGLVKELMKAAQEPVNPMGKAKSPPKGDVDWAPLTATLTSEVLQSMSPSQRLRELQSELLLRVEHLYPDALALQVQDECQQAESLTLWPHIIVMQQALLF